MSWDGPMCHWCRRAGLNGCFCGSARPQERLGPFCRECGEPIRDHDATDIRICGGDAHIQFAESYTHE
jgi:predicted amidophosphoribosyltransferase